MAVLKQDQEYTLRLNKFNSVVIQSIEETIGDLFGENITDTFFKTLSLNGCEKSDIPSDPGLFWNSVFYAFSSFMHTPIPLFLRIILERLCENLNLEYDKERSYHFVPYFNELKETYLQRLGARAQPKPIPGVGEAYQDGCGEASSRECSDRK